MNRPRMGTWTKGIVVGIIFGGLVATGISWASIPDSNGVIHGCYKTRGTTHSLKVIDSAVTSSCPSGYTSLDWSETGPQGPQGPSLLQGGYDNNGTTVSSALQTVDTMTITNTGYYELSAKLDVDLETGLGDVSCQLLSPTGDSDTGVYAGNSSGSLAYGTISLLVTPSDEITAGQSVTLSCIEPYGPAAGIFDIKIAALEVGSVSNSQL
ncbi:MAG TPA: hypothetical protein VEJ87_15235 [Acidimicrobiales bacterium]|nr:hypothetical protein [Acidimicrobiales bacterium]